MKAVPSAVTLCRAGRRRLLSIGRSFELDQITGAWN